MGSASRRVRASQTRARVAHILVVCSGNICRSPFAEGYLRMRLEQRGLRRWRVSSGGTLDIVGEPASEPAVRLARQYGFELEAHRSKGLASSTIARARVILVMEEAHLREVATQWPQKASAIRLVNEFHPAVSDSAMPPDVEDPVGGSIAEHRRCFEPMIASLDAFVGRLVESGLRT